MCNPLAIIRFYLTPVQLRFDECNFDFAMSWMIVYKIELGLIVTGSEPAIFDLKERRVIYERRLLDAYTAENQRM